MWLPPSGGSRRVERTAELTPRFFPIEGAPVAPGRSNKRQGERTDPDRRADVEQEQARAHQNDIGRANQFNARSGRIKRSVEVVPAQKHAPMPSIAINPIAVRWSELSHAGNRIAIATSNRFSASATRLLCWRT